MSLRCAGAWLGGSHGCRDVIKLTAQFVARNGRAFMNTLAQKEARNYQFDFLRPTHSLFPLFNRLVEEYAKVLAPPKPSRDFLASVVRNKLKAWSTAGVRTRYGPDRARSLRVLGLRAVPLTPKDPRAREPAPGVGGAPGAGAEEGRGRCGGRTQYVAQSQGAGLVSLWRARSTQLVALYVDWVVHQLPSSASTGMIL